MSFRKNQRTEKLDKGEFIYRNSKDNKHMGKNS
jgi:hypothetical protein